MGDERVVIPSTAEIGNIFQYCAIFCNRNIILEGVGSYGKREVLSPCPPSLTGTILPTKVFLPHMTMNSECLDYMCIMCCSQEERNSTF